VTIFYDKGTGLGRFLFIQLLKTKIQLVNNITNS